MCRATSLTDQLEQTVGRSHSSGVRVDRSWRSAARSAANRSRVWTGDGGCNRAGFLEGVRGGGLGVRN